MFLSDPLPHNHNAGVLYFCIENTHTRTFCYFCRNTHTFLSNPSKRNRKKNWTNEIEKQKSIQQRALISVEIDEMHESSSNNREETKTIFFLEFYL